MKLKIREPDNRSKEKNNSDDVSSISADIIKDLKKTAFEQESEEINKNLAPSVMKKGANLLTLVLNVKIFLLFRCFHILEMSAHVDESCLNEILILQVFSQLHESFLKES